MVIRTAAIGQKRLSYRHWKRPDKHLNFYIQSQKQSQPKNRSARKMTTRLQFYVHKRNHTCKSKHSLTPCNNTKSIVLKCFKLQICRIIFCDTSELLYNKIVAISSKFSIFNYFCGLWLFLCKHHYVNFCNRFDGRIYQFKLFSIYWATERKNNTIYRFAR